MRRFLVPFTVVAVVLAGGLALTPGARAADPYDWPAPAPSAPGSGASSGGDFATDTYGDPWDFANDADFSTVPEVGVQGTTAARTDTASDGTPGGWLRVNVNGGNEIRLVFDWPGVLPWGRDGRRLSVDAARYTKISFSACNRNAQANIGVRWEVGDGSRGQTSIVLPAGCTVQTVDLVSPPNRQLPALWAGTVTRLAFVTSPVQPAGLWEFDWVRLHRADAPVSPPAVPAVQVLSPSEVGQGDYATEVRGDAWDMNQPGDAELFQATGGVANGSVSATSTSNDPSVGFPVPVPFDGSVYHRATIDICYDGAFSLENKGGGGMNGRLQWQTDASGGRWSESQDIVVFPGCQIITLDLRSNPVSLVHDENTALKVGFCGRRVVAFHFDPHEDLAPRAFRINDVRLARDPSFTSTYDITFRDTAARASGATVYVSTDPNAYERGIRVGTTGGGGGVQTLRWNGTDANGNPVPAGQYWVFVVMGDGNAVSSGRSTAPVRYDPPGGTGLGEFVGIQPLRILDTRTAPLADHGCAAPAFGGQEFSLQVAGVQIPGRGAVPAGVSAVALNVTLVEPTSGTFLTVWPSGAPRPLASNLNGVPGSVVPNMVIAKVGADGKVNIFNSSGSSHVVVDVLGYFVNDGGDRLSPIAPVRTLDTRNGTGGRTTPLGPGQQLDVTTGPACGAGATGAALNVTAVSPTASTFLTVWPAGAAQPLASNLNATAGQIIPNMVMVKTTNGQASIFNWSGNVHVVVDVIGCFTGSGSALNPIVPVRALDTRTATGGHPGPFGQGETAEITVTGLPGVPAAGVTAVALNVTGVEPTASTFLTVWPAGVAQPLASNLNVPPGGVQPNMVIAKVTNGKIAVYNHAGATHVVVDVVGVFTG